MAHVEGSGELTCEQAGKIHVERLDRTVVESRTYTVTGADTAAPRLVGERYVRDVAEALYSGEAADVEGLYLFGMDPAPARFGPSRVVLEDQGFRAACNVVLQNQVAEVTDEQTSARTQDPTHFLNDRVAIEPPPALTRCHEVVARRFEPGRLSSALHEAGRQATAVRSNPCNLEEFGGDVETGDLEARACKAECDRTRSRAEVDRPVVGGDPATILQGIEEAGREAGSMTFVVGGSPSEVNTATLVIHRADVGLHVRNLARGSKRPTAPAALACRFMLRFITSGESHGPGLVATVEGLPSGLTVVADGISNELARRRLGFGRGPRMRLEKDEIEILGGVRFAKTLGGPVSVLIRNTEWPRWQDEMSSDPAGTATKVETTPRPGHADLVGMMKYDTHDARDILERASARETAARTIVGYLSKQVLREVGVEVFSHVTAIGSVTVPSDVDLPLPEDLAQIDSSQVRVLDANVESAMIAEIDSAKADRDTLGGAVEVLTYGLPAGLGSHVHWDRKLDGLLAGALMSIQAIKAVEIGDGLTQARSRGSKAHDEIIRTDDSYARRTNRAGGLEGGMTTGGVLRVTAYMKPIATLMRALDTVDVTTRQEAKAFRERSDVCAVPAAGVVAEQMVAYVLANEVTRSFGGDTVGDLRTNCDAYRTRLASF